MDKQKTSDPSTSRNQIYPAEGKGFKRTSQQSIWGGSFSACLVEAVPL